MLLRRMNWLFVSILLLSGLLLQGSLGANSAAVVATSCSVVQAMQSADDYWIAQHSTSLGDNGWVNATYHQGNMAFYQLTHIAKYYNYTRQWATNNKFLLQNGHSGPFFPDYQATGQVYLDLYAIDQQASEIADLRSRIKSEVASVQSGHTTYWNYVDALNMSMPNFARLGVLDNNAADLAAMQTLFNQSETVIGGHGLYNAATGLWWRDHNYVGTTTYWSRGNGWAIMALVKVLSVLPANDVRRPTYVKILQQMAAALKGIQRTDGFWNVDLGNANDFPGPESSGTAFFTLGIAWGINHGLLDAATYTPVAQAAWNGLVTKALHSNGFLGFVQGTGSKPSDHQPVTTNDTAAYAVGGLLLAGVQVAQLTPACL